MKTSQKVLIFGGLALILLAWLGTGLFANAAPATGPASGPAILPLETSAGWGALVPEVESEQVTSTFDWPSLTTNLN